MLEEVVVVAAEKQEMEEEAERTPRRGNKIGNYLLTQ